MESRVDYKSIEVRRFGDKSEPATINNNSTLTHVTAEGDVLNISFVFSSNYEPNIGVIRIEGDLKLNENKKTISGALEEWKTSGKKNLPKDIAEKVHNTILTNCVLEASILARDVKLPTPLPIPQVQIGKESTTDIQSYIR